MKPILIVTLALIAASSSQAAPLLWAGHLDEGGVAVDRTVSLTFTVTRDGVVVDSFVDPSFLVIDGNFVVELELPTPAAGEATGVWTADIIINGADFGEEPLVVEWPRAVVADVAEVAAVAASADAIDGAVPLALASLGSGGVPVAIENVVGFPAAFADGDQGIDVTSTARVSFANDSATLVNGSITTAQLSGTLAAGDFQNGSIATVDLAADAIDSPTDITGNLSLSSIAPDAIKAVHLSASQNRTTLFNVSNSLCSGAGTLTTLSTCQTVDTCAGASVRDCNGTCAVVAVTACANTAVGDLVFK